MLVPRRRPSPRPHREPSTPCLRDPLATSPVYGADRTTAYAAIGLIGPRAQSPLTPSTSHPTGLIVQEAQDCYEILLPAAHGPELWDYLLEAGAPYDLACVGHDALDRLTASHRLGYWA